MDKNFEKIIRDNVSKAEELINEIDGKQEESICDNLLKKEYYNFEVVKYFIDNYINDEEGYDTMVHFSLEADNEDVYKYNMSKYENINMSLNVMMLCIKDKPEYFQYIIDSGTYTKKEIGKAFNRIVNNGSENFLSTILKLENFEITMRAYNEAFYGLYLRGKEGYTKKQTMLLNMDVVKEYINHSSINSIFYTGEKNLIEHFLGLDIETENLSNYSKSFLDIYLQDKDKSEEEIISEILSNDDFTIIDEVDVLINIVRKGYIDLISYIIYDSPEIKNKRFYDIIISKLSMYDDNNTFSDIIIDLLKDNNVNVNINFTLATLLTNPEINESLVKDILKLGYDRGELNNYINLFSGNDSKISQVTINKFDNILADIRDEKLDNVTID